MKKMLLMFCFAILTGWVFAQKAPPSFRLNGYTNYVFDDRVDSYYSTTSYYNDTIKGGFQWGVGLEYMVKPTYGIELSYLRQDTKVPTEYYDNTVVIGDPVKHKDFDVAVSYIFIGGNRYFPKNAKIEPYVGFQLGMGIIDISNSADGGSESATKFAWGFKGGTNIWVSEKVGIKLQAGLASMTQAFGGSIYFGSEGVSPGLGSYSSMLQFSLGGGLTFRLGGGK